MRPVRSPDHHLHQTAIGCLPFWGGLNRVLVWILHSKLCWCCGWNISVLKRMVTWSGLKHTCPFTHDLGPVSHAVFEALFSKKRQINNISVLSLWPQCKPCVCYSTEHKFGLVPSNVCHLPWTCTGRVSVDIWLNCVTFSEEQWTWSQSRQDQHFLSIWMNMQCLHSTV